MQLDRFDIEEPPQGMNLDKEVFTLLNQHQMLRQHDGLLCQAYHVVFDEWQHLAETQNHWMVAIPEDRATERSDASIVRARREVADRVFEPTVGLDTLLNADWDVAVWQEYLDDRVDSAMTGRYGAEVWDEMEEPGQLREQVAWLLTNHPETRGSDKSLILQWYEVFGGWRKGSTEDGYTRYAIPKAHHWQPTTPESITASRRRWHQQGLFLPDEGTQVQRKQLERKARDAFRKGQDPWEVLG